MVKVIIDTSAWIEGFRAEGDQAFARHLKDLIENEQVLLPGIIQVELLRGAKSKKEFNWLKDLLKGLSYLPVPEEFWHRLSAFSFRLFRKGLTVPLTDTCIALLCIEHAVSLVHRDRHFDLIAQHSSLNVMDAPK
jgi:predicted nucleic acid-binding protein